MFSGSSFYFNNYLFPFKMKKKYTLKQKYYLLASLIELRVFCGYSITDLIGKQLSYFDFDKITDSIVELEKERDEINS